MHDPAEGDIPLLRGPVILSHLFLRNFVHEGDRAVDATCGNGHDTILLAHLVGNTGRVWAFDIQQDAICATAQKLGELGLSERVELLHAGHERMNAYIDGPVAAILFNLGYLPGGERTLTTSAETTVTALQQSLELVSPGGIVAITVYPGHQEGLCEQQAIENWARELLPRWFHVWRMGQMNVPATAPYFTMIQRTNAA